MSYRNRAKVRKFRKQITWAWDMMKFKWLSLDNSGKVIIFWSLVSFFSLFMPWVVATDPEISENSFSNLAWKSGVLVLTLLMVVLFFVFSLRKKEKLKLLSNVHIKDYSMYILSWLSILAISFIVLNFTWTRGLLIFSDNIVYGKWIIFNLIWWILILVWWILAKREENNNNSAETIFINEGKEDIEEAIEKKKNNMKLPF